MNEFIIILILILLNGVLAMAEISIISIRKSHLNNEIKRGSKWAAIALKLSEEPDRFLSTVQIGITAIGILTGIYSGDVLANDFALLLQQWGFSTSIAHPLAQTLIVLFVTYLTLILGELVPKRIGMSATVQTAKIIARPMFLLSRIASPFVSILAGSTSMIVRLLGIKGESEKVTEEEIKSMIQEGTKDGEVQEVEQDILERVFLLGDLRVNSLMIRRSELTTIKIGYSQERVHEIVRDSPHSIYPVIDDKEQILGVISLKNLLLNFNQEKFDLPSILSPATYFHETLSVYKALETMQKQQFSHALICDEFGYCQGMITLKEIFEGLVGSIDNTGSKPTITKRSDGQGWLIDGQYPLWDFLSHFEREDLFRESSNYTTLGGVILHQLQRIPQCGEVIHWHGFILEIIDMDGARIDKIEVKLKPR